METQSLPNSDNCINSLPDKENSVNHPEIPQTATTINLNLSEMTTKTVEEISSKIEQVFAKLQRNLEHNTRVFQEKSNGLMVKIDQAEEQLRKLLSQLESKPANSASNSTTTSNTESPVLVESTLIVESIVLSEETTKLEADETTEN